MKRISGIVLILLIAANVIFAQQKYDDRLIKRDGTTINCIIKEIADEEIKFIQEGISSDVLMGIDKSKVEKIIFADGKEYLIDNVMSTYEDLNLQRKNAVKFNLFIPISGAYALSYERSIKPARSIEAEIGLISTNMNNNMNRPEANGMFFKAGFKMMRSPDYYIKGMKYAHILKGSYVKPEIAVSSFTYKKSDNSITDNGSTTKMAILVNVGKQVIYTNLFAIDFFVGAGYALGKIDPDLYYYSFAGFSSETSFIMSGGLRVGFLF